MKKQDRAQLDYLDRVWRRRNKAFAKSHGFAERRAKRLRRLNLPRKISERVKIMAPEIYNLFDSNHRGPLLKFVERIKKCLSQGSQVHILFDKTELLHSGGTLLFVANIHQLLVRYPGKITCSYPTNSTVEQMFQHIGLLERLGKSARLKITADNVLHWHFICGETTELAGVKSLFSVLATQLTDETSSGLFDSISEAVTNVIHHAYQGAEAPPGDVRWWLFAQLKNNLLEIAICDLGIGISNSLKEKPELANILPALLRRLRKRKESGLIEVAIESSRSRTKLPHRGKGLPDMLTFSKEAEVGVFLVYSHSGYFAYNALRQSETARDLPSSVDGTVIVWQIPLASQDTP